jgi:hypothetical protein
MERYRGSEKDISYPGYREKIECPVDRRVPDGARTIHHRYDRAKQRGRILNEAQTYGAIAT